MKDLDKNHLIVMFHIIIQNIIQLNSIFLNINRELKESTKYKPPTDHLSPRFLPIRSIKPGPGSYPGVRAKLSHIKYSIGKSIAPYRAPLKKNNEPSPVSYNIELSEKIVKPKPPSFVFKLIYYRVFHMMV